MPTHCQKVATAQSLNELTARDIAPAPARDQRDQLDTNPVNTEQFANEPPRREQQSHCRMVSYAVMARTECQVKRPEECQKRNCETSRGPEAQRQFANVRKCRLTDVCVIAEEILLASLPSRRPAVRARTPRDAIKGCLCAHLRWLGSQPVSASPGGWGCRCVVVVQQRSALFVELIDRSRRRVRAMTR